MKTLKFSQLIEMLQNSKGAFPIGITSRTDARTLKTGNPFPETWKTSVCVAFTGVNYENSVNRESERQGGQGGFKSAGLKDYQEEIVRNKVIRHKTEGTLYLRTQTAPKQREIRAGKVVNYFDRTTGKFISRELVKPFLPKKAISKKQLAVGVGDETTKDKRQMDVRDYKFESIKTLRIGGNTFALVPDTAPYSLDKAYAQREARIDSGKVF